MEAPKSLRRPTNWQDFESLCKKLWEEIWNCPEIKKNGRPGQAQKGVDIYGIPFNENEYFGIQCKGKDEYTEKQFTEGEITKEIENAKKFEPALKKLYFATTAVKDAGIEEYVRKKNIENKSKGLFEVHLFSWEDIVDLIEGNRNTRNWYVKSQNYKSSKSISVTFHDGSKVMECKPKFKKDVRLYRKEPLPTWNSPLSNSTLAKFAQQVKFFDSFKSHSRGSGTKVNLSFSEFYIQIHNTGMDPLEEYKLLLEFEGEIQDISDTNEEGFLVGIISRYKPNTEISFQTRTGKIIPKKNILVGDDVLNSENIFIKPFAKDSKLLIRWKLISKDFKDAGELVINFRPRIEHSYETVIVDDPSEVGKIEGEIEDYITDKQ